MKLRLSLTVDTGLHQMTPSQYGHRLQAQIEAIAGFKVVKLSVRKERPNGKTKRN